MYKCQRCKKIIAEKIVQMTKVIKKRKLKPCGYETVKEVKVCPGCYDKYK